MTLTTTSAPPQTEASLCVFDRIVVGIDDAPHGVEAARQAATLLAPGGSLHLVAAVDAAKASHAGFYAPGIADQMLGSARETLDHAAEAAHPTTSTLVRGRPVECLLKRIRDHDATLITLGAHEHRRGAGLLLGAVGSTLLREAPCSVLLARREGWLAGYPERIVAGVDGSPQSHRAVEVAEALSARFGARLTLLTALGGKLRDPAAVTASYPGAIVDERAPVDALVAAADAADLIVVGSRGLHGLQALGSVSERVAHRAHASVLVVRGHTHQGQAHQGADQPAGQ